MKHSEIKQTIISTASNLFYRNGYNATGINEIIDKSGIAKATLYSHFRSKEDIGQAYIRFKNDSFIEEIKSYCVAHPKGKEQVLALYGFLQRFYDSEGFNGCWCTKTVAEIPPENEKIRNEIKIQKNRFINVITTLVDNNLDYKNSDTISKIARQLYLLYESAVVESHLHQEDWPIKEAKNMASTLLL